MSRVALRSKVPGSVRADVREFDGRSVVWVEVDATDRKGALSSEASSMLEHAALTAGASRLPLVGVLRSSGADIVEGFGALHGWGRAAHALTNCSGVVPTILIVDGPAVSGPALLLGIADHVVLTEAAYAFVSGPTMVADFTGVVIDNDELGGAASHSRYSGAATLVATDLEQAIDMASQLLAYFPQHNDQEAPLWPTDDEIARQTPEAGALIPATSTGSYDVRAVIRSLADDGELLELRPRWAANVVTALTTIGGMPVGVVANQPLALAGTLDIPASQ
ncbi:MAG TPA: carboxyl transferase domain-containing protein, partial [Ilumatobacteraceae bacterium]|nr:carboxyl transferase domain-containing protein [Ilumatobacteraceae bacterium]